MKKMKNLMYVLSALFLFVGLYSLNTDRVVAGPPENFRLQSNPEARARMRNPQVAQVKAVGTLRKATDLYEAFVKGPHGQLPESILAKAQCVAVLPDVVTGALIVGGTHGVGITSCKENNQWSAPAFVKLKAVSLGAQIGGKSSDIILVALNDDARNAIKKGRFSLGADASVVAGTFDQNFETSNHGAVAYTRTEGAFIGASLSGGQLTSDDWGIEAFYGEKLNYLSLLEGRVTPQQNDQVDRFTALLPK